VVCYTCRHHAFGGGYRDSIFITLLVMMGSIVRRRIMDDVQDLLKEFGAHAASESTVPESPLLSNTASPGGTRCGRLKEAPIKTWDRIRIKMDRYTVSSPKEPKAAFVRDVVRGTIILPTKVDDIACGAGQVSRTVIADVDCARGQAEIYQFVKFFKNSSLFTVLREKNSLNKRKTRKTGIPHLLINVRWNALTGQEPFAFISRARMQLMWTLITHRHGKFKIMLGRPVE